ncbi:bifunctional RNase H/acid phosphatase [Actinopolyspora erythraea]|uniref:Acid phosphatase n=1 Tax=Actinopolyspora erythraea TaxID=414996 RepID=A0A099D1V2_9ACTN|nr:bifunctional RNase H/acid phosphatase [Actinopolyspora erythraea]ASU78036.1 bifunctional RNase H/acid phosphatase [Actinopolyspora erythraea]KGI79802.1 acid phosphatase [Actinopolyspora erythraea]
MSTRVIVEADGGSRGNPGAAGFGAVVRDADTGAVLAERSGGLGEATNNVAEYRGMIAGVTAALELGAAEAEIRLDSKLVVEQMSGRWRVKHEALRPLAAEARRLVSRLTSARFEWIPRNRNTHADRLANEAMDRQADGEEPVPEPAAPTVSADPAARTEPVTRSSAAEAASASPTPGGVASWSGAVGSPTRLLLLRHGQSPMSVDKRYSGRGDVPLTELGERQARAAAGRLLTMDELSAGEGAVPVLSSPLSRARGTAEAVARAVDGRLVSHDGLMETDFGAWEGLTFTEASERYPELHRGWLGDPAVAPPEGESMNAVFERVDVVRRELLREYAGRTIVLVTHVTPIKALLRMALGVGPELFYRLHLDLASLSVAEFYPDGNASVRLVNDTSHLRGL